MILFTLRCSHGHEFEGWFRDGEGFEAQQKAGEIACPECGQTLGEIDPHGIYGEASEEESRELTDEGISFGRIPWVPQTDS